MLVDRFLYPVHTLGPGNRLTIWTVGCSKHCPKCANPELWDKGSGRDLPVKELLRMIKEALGGRRPDGITITGGDPLEQPEELLELLEGLSEITDDILVYTGYAESELKDHIEKELLEKLVSKIGVLIDGRYVAELNDGKCALRGSTNQNIIFYDRSLEERYRDYLKQPRKIQNFYCRGKLISVGIHNN